MVTPAVGSVVLIRFPFSDLSSYKLRPAVVLAEVDRNDWILCQITSNAYMDKRAVKISNQDFATGSLMRTSYARPGKLFSANISIMERLVGELKSRMSAMIIDAVIDVLKSRKSQTPPAKPEA